MVISQPKAVWWSGMTVRRLRAGSGLILLAFVAMHLINHALLLISVHYADQARSVLAAPWRSLVGTGLLYGAAAVHVSLALESLYRRQTLNMPPVEMLRLILGLLVPYFIAEHAIGTRLNLALYGLQVGYRDVVRTLWSTAPMLGVQQVIALIVAWTHGCIGVSFLIRYRPGWRAYGPLLLIAAVMIPALALVGFAVAGRWLAIQDSFPGLITELYPPELRRMANISMPSSAQRAATLAAAGAGFKIGYIVLIAAIMVAREFRLYRARARAIVIRYAGGQRVRVAPGTSVLEASRANAIPHYAVCGGNGRCSTCRVHVIASDGTLPPRTAAERATLARINAGPDVRLACQLRPSHDLSVSLTLNPSSLSAEPLDDRETPAPREREIAVLFCDLRDFTKFSEKRLPYDVVFLLNRYFVVVGEAVAAAGGRIDKFIGDGAMAVFGYDTGPEQTCRNALLAAEGILRGIERLNAELEGELGLTLDIAIGLHFGPAVVGILGFGAAMAETAVGDTVNVASRLETVAKQADRPLAVSSALLLRSGLSFLMDEVHAIDIRGREWPVSGTLLSRSGLSLLTEQIGHQGD